MRDFFIALAYSSGLAANITFIMVALIAALNDGIVLVKFPFKEWIIEIPAAIIGSICLLVKFKEDYYDR